MYGTVADWIIYAALRGLTVVDEAASSQALVRASDYIRTRYVLRFLDDYDDTAPQVEEAAYIAAAYELSTPGFWAKTFTSAQTKVLVGVDSLRWSPVKLAGQLSVDSMLPTSPAIDALLVPLTRYGMPAAAVV